MSCTQQFTTYYFIYCSCILEKKLMLIGFFIAFKSYIMKLPNQLGGYYMPNHYFLSLSFIYFIIFSCLLALLIPTKTFAQQLPCYFDEHLEYLFQLDPIYREAILMNEDDLQEMMEENPQAIMNSQIYTIPVVFHVIHKDEALGVGTNISSTLINQALMDLNDYFRDAQNLGNDVEIEFCLAVRNPEGGSTDGINRVSGLGVNYYSTSGLTVGQNEEEVKNLSRWPNIDYLNVWIVSEINHTTIEIPVLARCRVRTPR